MRYDAPCPHPLPSAAVLAQGDYLPNAHTVLSPGAAAPAHATAQEAVATAQAAGLPLAVRPLRAALQHLQGPPHGAHAHFLPLQVSVTGHVQAQLFVAV